MHMVTLVSCKLDSGCKIWDGSWFLSQTTETMAKCNCDECKAKREGGRIFRSLLITSLVGVGTVMSGGTLLAVAGAMGTTGQLSYGVQKLLSDD